ncbi:hypothetical protein [Desulfopila sp. IMCC35008]|uniref:hypothetical protein n=1 Tax=Desulfopila sp. IMCC35008 TaxID=2653858 RepID=UPI0013D2B20B|nr:hypothetical protein [Desulfopila sp. IMCC35008]
MSENPQTPEQKKSDKLGQGLMIFWAAIGLHFGIGLGRGGRGIMTTFQEYSFIGFMPVAMTITVCIASFIWWLSYDDTVNNPDLAMQTALVETGKSFIGISLLVTWLLFVLLPSFCLLFNINSFFS